MAEQLKAEGNAAYSRGDWHSAIESYSKAIEKEPLPACFSNRAACYLKLDRFHDAVRDCKLGLDSNPPQKLAAKMWYRLGTAKRGLGLVDDAREALTKAVDLAEGDKEKQSIKDELSSLKWDEQKHARRQKFKLAPKKDSSDMRGSYVEVKHVDQLPSHLVQRNTEQPPQREPEQVSSAASRQSTFTPPERLTNFTFTQLSRAAPGDMPAIYRYVFGLNHETVLPKIYAQGGINHDAIDFLLDTAIYCHEPSSSQWEAQTIKIVNSMRACTRFETTKMFTDSSKLSKLQNLGSSELSSLISSVF